MTRFLRMCVLSLILMFAVPASAYAAQASLAISPKDGTFIVGNQFTVGVVLDTGGASVNAVEGKMRYLPDDIEIVRIDKEKSPITSWTIEPDYTTEEGLISFGGVHPDGIEGKGKTLFSITFRVKRSGEARIRIASGAAILAEGGAGTNILTDLRGGTYTLSTDGDRIEALRGGPSLLRSSSHPDEVAWYQSPDVAFEWSRSPDTDQIRFSVDQNPEGTPTGLLPADTEGKNHTLDSGVWYGHLSLHDDSGWSPIGHLRVQVDTERPDILQVTEVPRGDAKEPRPTIALEARDARSGVSHYEIAVNGGEPVRFEDDGNHRYELPALPPGDHVVSVRVFDRAGNSVTETIVITVEGLPLPRVEPIPSVLSVGGEVDLEGNVEEGMTARVAIGFDGGEWKTEEVASGPGGAFIHTFVFPQEGIYRLKVQAIDARGATSEWTPEILVRVEPRSLLGAIGTIGGGAGVLMSLVFLAGGLLIGVWYGRMMQQGSSAPIPAYAENSANTQRKSSLIRRSVKSAMGSGSLLWGRAKRLLSKQTKVPLEEIQKTHSLPISRMEDKRETFLQKEVFPTATPLSLRRRTSDNTPPHRPTVLGR